MDNKDRIILEKVLAEIKATRNIVAHGYQSLNFNVIYNTVKISVPEVKSKIEGLLCAKKS